VADQPVNGTSKGQFVEDGSQRDGGRRKRVWGMGRRSWKSSVWSCKVTHDYKVAKGKSG
jgi:hypothetical protein